MPERGSVFQTTQVGLEAVSGTVVPAFKRLLAVEISPKPMVPTVAQRNMGSKFTSSTFNKKEHTQGDMKGEACYRTLSYLFSSILTTATVATPGGGTLSRTWTFQPNTYSPDTPQTFTVESGSSAGAERFPFATLDSFALRYTTDDVGVSGTWFGQTLVEAITLTPTQNEVYNVDVGTSTGGTFTLTYNSVASSAQAYNVMGSALQTSLNGSWGANTVTVTGGNGQTGTPFILTFTGGGTNGTHTVVTGSGASLTGGTHTLTIAEFTVGGTLTDITPIPVDPTQMEFFVSVDGTTYTQLSRCFEAEFAINNRFSQVMTLDDRTTTFSAVVEKAIGMSGMMVLEHDSVASGYMADLRNKTDKWFRILMTGPLIEGALKYTCQIDFPFHFKDNTRGDKKDVWASTYHMEPVYKSTWNGGAALKIVVQNDITAL